MFFPRTLHARFIPISLINAVEFFFYNHFYNKPDIPDFPWIKFLDFGAKPIQQMHRCRQKHFTGLSTSKRLTDGWQDQKRAYFDAIVALPQSIKIKNTTNNRNYATGLCSLPVVGGPLAQLDYLQIKHT